MQCLWLNVSQNIETTRRYWNVANQLPSDAKQHPRTFFKIHEWAGWLQCRRIFEFTLHVNHWLHLHIAHTMHCVHFHSALIKPTFYAPPSIRKVRLFDSYSDATPWRWRRRAPKRAGVFGSQRDFVYESWYIKCWFNDGKTSHWLHIFFAWYFRHITVMKSDAL